tara:strand:+ start:327 stop:800 length:474 start_codon:yes stop_codon:yes gene_type:complete
MGICMGVSTISGFFMTAMVGTITPDEVKTYTSLHLGTESDLLRFKEPMGSYGIQYDLTNFIQVFAEHQSSPMQCDDHPGLNYAGFKFTAPLTDDVTAYSGIAVKSGQFDNKNTLKNPIIISGIEVGGNTIKLFSEYMHSAERLNNGRLYGGVKYIFN